MASSRLTHIWIGGAGNKEQTLWVAEIFPELKRQLELS